MPGNSEMLFLHFQIGDGCLALATDRIVEILPLAEFSKARNAPHTVAGFIEYRSRFIPVADLCELELRRPARRRLSTRIIVASLPGHEDILLGLIAENVTEMLRCDPADFMPFATGPRGLVQQVELENLLPASLLTWLHSDPVDGP